MVQSCTAAAANCPECYSKGVTPVHGGFECHSGAFPSARNALAALQSHYVSVWNFCNVARAVTAYCAGFLFFGFGSLSLSENFAIPRMNCVNWVQER